MLDKLRRNSRLRWFVIGGVAFVVLAAVGFWWFVLRSDAPPEVDNTAANEQLDEDLAAEGDAGEPAAATGFDGNIEGVWTVDNSIGEFTFDSASGSFAGFRVDEELAGPGSVVAVGRTGDVSGSIEVVGDELVATEITVDLTTIVSDRSGRQGAIQRALDTSQFPTAVFTLVEPVVLPAEAAALQVFEVTAVGDLTIRGVTREASFAIEANVRDDGIAVVTGSTEMVWDDFGVTPPSAPIVVSVADEGVVEFQLLLTKG